MKKHVLLVITLGLGLAGCCSRSSSDSSSSKPTLERGWIGGEFKTTKRKPVAGAGQSSVYVKQVYPNTPGEQAGLKTSDLVVKVNDSPVTDLKDFRALIDAAPPGSRATIQVLRSGESLDLPITIGRESYHEWHAITLGFRLASKLDLWPDPDFSLGSLACYDRVQDRTELNSPEVVLQQQEKDSQGERGVHSSEGWNAWLVIFGANAHKRILKQEIVPADEARPVARADISRQ